MYSCLNWNSSVGWLWSSHSLSPLRRRQWQTISKKTKGTRRASCQELTWRQIKAIVCKPKGSEDKSKPNSTELQSNKNGGCKIIKRIEVSLCTRRSQKRVWYKCYRNTGDITAFLENWENSSGQFWGSSCAIGRKSLNLHYFAWNETNLLCWKPVWIPLLFVL